MDIWLMCCCLTSKDIGTQHPNQAFGAHATRKVFASALVHYHFLQHTVFKDFHHGPHHTSGIKCPQSGVALTTFLAAE